MAKDTRAPELSRAGCELLPAGQNWDAVRVPRSVGLTTIEVLGRRSGAVIEDPREPCLYWFVAAGTAGQWAVDNTQALGEGDFLSVPPARRAQGPGSYWRICPGGSDWLTDADALRAAVEDALGPRLGVEHFV
ncbi:hypothetical protein [Streptomyces altiplanensis]